MNITDHKELLDRIETLAARKATGTPCELAVKLGVSERNLYRLVKYLRETGVDITYSRTLQSYMLK